MAFGKEVAANSMPNLFMYEEEDTMMADLIFRSKRVEDLEEHFQDPIKYCQNRL